MKPFRNAVIWIIALLLAACAGVDVHTDYDASADFSRYRTYYWKKTPTTPNPLNAERIVSEIDARLYARGWRKVPENQADAALSAHVTAREQERIDTMYNTMGPGWYGGMYGGAGWAGTGMATSTVTYYTIGTLIVDIFDAKSKRSIWHATAEGTVTLDPQENMKKIREATAEMFKNFPPSRTAASPSQ